MSLNDKAPSFEIEKVMKKCENLKLIGRLANYPPTSINQYNYLQFFLEPLCDEPKAVVQLENFDALTMNYIGFDSQQAERFLPDGYDFEEENEHKRMAKMEDYLQDRYVVFSPVYTFNSKRNRWYKNCVIEKIVVPSRGVDTSFVSIPVVEMRESEFERKLKSREYFALDEFDGELVDEIEMILCGNYIYKVNLDASEDVFTCMASNKQYYRCNDDALVEKIDVSSFVNDRNVMVVSHGTCFVEVNLYSQFMLETQVVPLEVDRKKTVSESKSVPTRIAVNESSEMQFLRCLQQACKQEGLQYCFDDLVNFHTSLKSNPLTVLAGMSGTGKSKLALQYAKMLSLKEEDNTLLFMPISPSYQEPSDVLGYYNALNETYVPSETGFVQLLQHAMEHEEQMHMVIFDEMNLAQIEYWFSPFISILENDANERVLKLYDDRNRCLNGDAYPSRITIGDNILFVGTVNIDDTTKTFSDRLLDRTFVIDLQKMSFTKFFESQRMVVDGMVDCVVSYETYHSWRVSLQQSYTNVFINHEDELAFLDALDGLLQKAMPQHGISYRVLRNIGNYLLNLPRKNERELLVSRKAAFDLLVKQAILTKVRGTSMQLEQLVGVLDDEGNLKHSQLIDLFTMYAEVSSFDQCIVSLKKKAEELRINGYTN